MLSSAYVAVLLIDSKFNIVKVTLQFVTFNNLLAPLPTTDTDELIGINWDGHSEYLQTGEPLQEI